jgi:glycosyltransferase involved in cell wall biosynthesis
LALPSYAEGCPNVILEALNCGRPVVATQVGDIPELVDRSCGLLIPVGDVEALTSAMDSALDSTWDEDLIAKRFRRSWKNVAQEVLAICEASLDDGQARCARN